MTVLRLRWGTIHEMLVRCLAQSKHTARDLTALGSLH